MRMSLRNRMLGAGLAAGLAGCSSFTGLAGSKSELACKAPDGVLCTSVSGLYANSLEDGLPGQQPQSVAAGDKTMDKTAAPAPAPYYSPRDLATPNSGDPIRMAPLVLRVWIAPWEDIEGDLHDQHYVYTVVHSGKWLIESNRQSIQNAYRPVFPLKGKPSVGADKAKLDETPAIPTIPLPQGEAGK